jgi:hypothetical protein
MASTNDISLAAPLVSIVMPCCGMIEYTKLCVPSVLRFSRAPFELIFLDIGSLDGTAEYLAGLCDGLRGRVRGSCPLYTTKKPVWGGRAPDRANR